MLNKPGLVQLQAGMNWGLHWSYTICKEIGKLLSMRFCLFPTVTLNNWYVPRPRHYKRCSNNERHCGNCQWLVNILLKLWSFAICIYCKCTGTDLKACNNWKSWNQGSWIDAILNASDRKGQDLWGKWNTKRCLNFFYWFTSHLYDDRAWLVLLCYNLQYLLMARQCTISFQWTTLAF